MRFDDYILFQYKGVEGKGEKAEGAGVIEEGEGGVIIFTRN
jgi:hypothetical protein